MFRIRSKYTIGEKKDYKVEYTLNQLDVDVKITGLDSFYERELRFRVMGSLDSIDNYILQKINKMIPELNGTEIIQNPFNEVPPSNLRPLSNESILVNNGMEIRIKWFRHGLEYPNNAYSFVDENGKELDVSKDNYTKVNITRMVTIHPPNNIENIYYSTNILDVDYTNNEYEKFNYNDDIINLIIEKWSKKTNTELSLDLENKIEYVSYRNPIKENKINTETKLKYKTNLKNNTEVIVNSDTTLIFEIVDSNGNPYNTTDFIFSDNTQDVISSEYLVDGFEGLEEQEYLDEEVFDDDDKTSDDDNTFTKVPSNNKTIDAISKAHSLIHNKHNSDNKIKGRCASFTWNKARIFVAKLKGMNVDDNLKPAGGNANGDGFHKNLQGIGYKKYDKGNLSTIELKQILNNQSNWSIGDVVVYWNTDGPKDQNCRKYGHTIIYSGGHGSSSRDMWTTDNINNWGSGFCYANQAKNGCNKWNLLIFKSPSFNI